MSFRAHLPHILREIADVAGDEAALKLAAERGGTSISVPKACADDHWLVRILGRAGADRLSEMYGGEVVVLPMGPTGSHAAIRRRLAEALDRGASAGEAARAAGVHSRTAKRARAKRRAAADGRQGRLL